MILNCFFLLNKLNHLTNDAASLIHVKNYPILLHNCNIYIYYINSMYQITW